MTLATAETFGQRGKKEISEYRKAARFSPQFVYHVFPYFSSTMDPEGHNLNGFAVRFVSKY